MHVHKMTMSGFRGATLLPLELHNRLNIFFGTNGSGKSSILDASAILLSWFVNRIKHDGSSGRPIIEPDIRNGEASANLSNDLQLSAYFLRMEYRKATHRL